MAEFEVFVEDINPCGGEKHARKKFLEVEAESPEAYVRENGRLPIVSVAKNQDGDLVITTADTHGNTVRYTFTG